MRLVLATLVVGGLSNGIHTNVKKLTDFTAEVTETYKYLANVAHHPGEKLYNISGSARSLIKLDLEHERVSITTTGTVTFHDRVDARAFKGGAEVTGTAAFAFSGEKRAGAVKVALASAASEGPWAGWAEHDTFCVDMSAPPGVLPPGAALEFVASQKASEFDAYANSAPHDDVVYRGVNAVKYSYPIGDAFSEGHATTIIGHDGTPMLEDETWQVKVGGKSVGTPASYTLDFTSWTEGADVESADYFHCLGGGSMDLDEHPEALLPMLALEHLMKSKSMNGQSPFPADPVQFLFGAAISNAQASPTESWSVALAAVAGAVGALVVMGIATMRKTPRGEPLLSA